jgi:deazaflavin-dependent oxidoreductase (nitroreductase family)
MQVPRIMRGVNRAVTNHLMSPLASFAPPLSVVHHTGRKSGNEYRTPVLALLVDEGMVTPLPYGTDVDWCLNVMASGRYEITFLGRRMTFENPRIADADTALPQLPACLRPGLRLLDLPGYLTSDRVDAD